ncbi:MAG TPA: hypothetical protein ENK53_08500 [Thiotrichales bacterium]|nr:hypothetical protein [Thiotrichales bacterium]
MKDESGIREQISALVDGELPEAECRLLLARMQRDPALRLTWERYLLAGEVLRNQAGRLYDPRFSQRVMAAIESRESLALPEQGSGGRSVPGWFRTAASMAVAAGVAVVAVLLLQPEQAREGSTGAAPAPSLARSATDPKTYRRVAPSQIAAGPRAAPSPELIENLSQYVVNHNEFAARAGLPHLARQVSAVESGRVEVK